MRSLIVVREIAAAPRISLFYFRIDMPICNEDIHPSVVITVEEPAAKAQDPARCICNTYGIADLVIKALAVTPEYTVGNRLKIRYVKIKEAAIIADRFFPPG